MPFALMATGVLAVLATWLLSGNLESDLGDRSRAALAAAGVGGGAVSFDGRDATLRGFPADQADRAAEVVRGVTGVRAAEASGSIPAPEPPAPAPAPAPAPVPAPAAVDPPRDLQAEIDRVLAEAPITFEPDTDQPTEQGVQTVRRIADLIRDAPAGATFEVGGHVARAKGEDTASPSARELSQDRADAVKKLLVEFRVPAERVAAKGYGDTRPNASGDDRRVEIRVR